MVTELTVDGPLPVTAEVGSCISASPISARVSSLLGRRLSIWRVTSTQIMPLLVVLRSHVSPSSLEIPFTCGTTGSESSSVRSATEEGDVKAPKALNLEPVYVTLNLWTLKPTVLETPKPSFRT